MQILMGEQCDKEGERDRRRDGEKGDVETEKQVEMTHPRVFVQLMALAVEVIRVSRLNLIGHHIQ